VCYVVLVLILATVMIAVTGSIGFAQAAPKRAVAVSTTTRQHEQPAEQVDRGELLDAGDPALWWTVTSSISSG